MYPLNKETLKLQKKTKALLKDFEKVDKVQARRYRRQVKKLTAFWQNQKTLNEGTFLDERYPLDYYFYSERLNEFVQTYYKTLNFVLVNALQPEPLSCDEYQVDLNQIGEELVITVLDSGNWRYMQQRYGCARHSNPR